jgi:hypothetical protein
MSGWQKIGAVISVLWLIGSTKRVGAVTWVSFANFISLAPFGML